MDKYWGSIVIDDFREAIKNVPGAVKEWNNKKEIKIDAVKFDNGDIGLSIFDINTKERYRIGSIRPSKFNNR